MPFPDKPLSQAAPNPHFGIFSHVVGTPLQAMSVGFLQKFPHLFALLSPHCIFPGTHHAQSVLSGSQ